MSKKGKHHRLEQSAIKRAKLNVGIDAYDQEAPLPPGAIAADHNELGHNNTYGLLPVFYVDQLVTCKICGKEEVWLAINQKWWYEEKKASINSKAIHCRSCRRAIKEDKQ